MRNTKTSGRAVENKWECLLDKVTPTLQSIEKKYFSSNSNGSDPATLLQVIHWFSHETLS